MIYIHTYIYIYIYIYMYISLSVAPQGKIASQHVVSSEWDKWGQPYAQSPY